MNISGRHNNIVSYSLLAIILLLVGFLYWPVGSFGWILGSDQLLLIENNLVHSLKANSLYDMFFTSQQGRYEPLALLSFAFDINLWNIPDLRAVHLMNLLLHLLNIILLFRLIQLVSKKTTVAIFTTMLFAFHPSNAEAIAWISARSILLGTFMLLLAVLFYVYYLGDGRKLFYRLSILFFIFSLVSNPTGLIYPFVILFLDHRDKRTFNLAFKEKYPVIVISALWLVMAIMVRVESENIGQSLQPTWLSSIYFFAYTSSLLFTKAIIPINLVAYHPFPHEISVYSVVMVLVILLATVMLIWWRRRFKIEAPLFMGFMLAVLINYFLQTKSGAMYYDSHAYVPMIFLFILLALFIDKLINTLNAGTLVNAIIFTPFLLYSVLLAYISDNRREVFNDNAVLWTEVIEAYPDDGHAFFMRGDHWAMNGDYEKAKFDYNQCVKRDANAYMAMNNLGLIYMDEGDQRLAIKEFSRAIDHNPDYYKPYLNKGISLMRLSRYEEAREMIDHAIALEPENALIFYNSGLLYERMNDLQAAIDDFSVAIRLEPDRLLFYKDRGKAYVWMKQFALAEMDYSRAIGLDPENGELWFRRSLARTSQDNFKGGLEDAMMAKSLGFPVEEEYIKGLARQMLEDNLKE